MCGGFPNKEGANLRVKIAQNLFGNKNCTIEKLEKLIVPFFFPNANSIDHYRPGLLPTSSIKFLTAYHIARNI
jgi:hypothetical protein